MGLAPETVHVLEVAAPMHDIGKIGIPDSVLLKEGPLNTEEDAVMKTHPRMGYDILKGSPSKYLSMGAIIALGHHERFDGSGYPNGLHGEDIPVVARIVAVADVFDALISERPYKHAWSIDEGFAYLISQKGRHFDPRCVDAFLSGADKVREIQKAYADA
jgi:two-component system response regulator RpfG